MNWYGHKRLKASDIKSSAKALFHPLAPFARIKRKSKNNADLQTVCFSLQRIGPRPTATFPIKVLLVNCGCDSSTLWDSSSRLTTIAPTGPPNPRTMSQSGIRKDGIKWYAFLNHHLGTRDGNLVLIHTEASLAGSIRRCGFRSGSQS